MFYVVCITFNKMQTFPTIRSACVCTSHVVFRKDKPDAIPRPFGALQSLYVLPHIQTGVETTATQFVSLREFRT